MEKFKYVLKEKFSKLPKTTGVYVFKSKGVLLYIGKASDIKKRVKNHFQQSNYRDDLFINQTSKIGYIKTNSEIEALIIEANLIKKYQPKFNILWKDDKKYLFVAITKEEFPKVFLTHQTNSKSKLTYIGPFVDAKALKQTLKLLRKVFPYRSCQNLPKKPCLWYQLDRCPAPCLLKSNLAKQIPITHPRIKTETHRNIKNLIKILKGKKKEALNNLKKEMKTASRAQSFEKAAKIRDQIKALEKVLSHSKVFESQEVPKEEIIQKTLKNLFKQTITRVEAYDISNIQGKEATGSMVTFIDNLSNKNYYRRFKIRISGKPDDIAMIKEVLDRRLKHKEWEYPDLILIDGGKAQLNVTVQILKSYNLKIKTMALAKKKNELYLENKKEPIKLDTFPDPFKFLIMRMRDEAHRFAITYHKKLRQKVLLKN